MKPEEKAAEKYAKEQGFNPGMDGEYELVIDVFLVGDKHGYKRGTKELRAVIIQNEDNHRKWQTAEKKIAQRDKNLKNEAKKDE